MTAVQHAKSSARRASLRVVKGRKFNGRPRLTPWLAFTLVVVVALFGIVVTQTSLDRGAFELAELNRSINTFGWRWLGWNRLLGWRRWQRKWGSCIRTPVEP